MNLTLDPWQKEVLATKGNIVLRSGRQVGKSTVIAIKAGEYAANYPNKTILVIASVERQAYLIFDMIFAYIEDNHKEKIDPKKRSSSSRIVLTNGSIIRCLPAGIDGSGIRGYKVDLLIADEAAFISERVWSAVTPMLMTTIGKPGGGIILLSTPFGKDGYFYQRFNDPNYTNFHVSSEEVIKKRKISNTWTKVQQKGALAYLEAEKANMTELEYAQEYLGEFVDEYCQFFPTDLIEACMFDEINIPERDTTNYLGVDVGHMGKDDSVFFSVTKHDKTIYQLEMEQRKKLMIPETADVIFHKDTIFNYREIYIDGTGIGGGVYDIIRMDIRTRRKAVSIDAAKKSIDWNNPNRKHAILKEDLYRNLLTLMQQNRLKLKYDPDIVRSLKCIKKEITPEKRVKIYGHFDHITEALVRAAWGIKSERRKVAFL